MKLEDARGYESWTPMGKEECFIPLFLEHEVPKAKEVIDVLNGMDIERAFELLEKVKKYLLQAAQVQAPSED